MCQRAGGRELGLLNRSNWYRLHKLVAATGRCHVANAIKTDGLIAIKNTQVYVY